MTTRELINLLSKIIEVHPEAADAEVWAKMGEIRIHPTSVGYDRKSKPARIKLEE